MGRKGGRQNRVEVGILYVSIGEIGVLLGCAVLGASWRAMLPLCVAAGVLHTIGSSSANVAVATVSPLSRQGLSMGIKQAAVPIAAILVGVSVPVIVVPFGWRAGFLTFSAVPVLSSFAIAWRNAWPRRFPVRGHHLARYKEMRDSEREAYTRPVHTRLIENRRLRALAATGFVSTLASSSLGAFFVVTAVGVGMSAARAGVLVAVGSALGLAIRLLGGAVVDARSWSGTSSAAVLMMVGVVGYGLLAVPTGASLVVGAMLAYGAGQGWQGLFHFGIISAFPLRPGHSTGVARVGLAGGAGLGPLARGLLASQQCVHAMWALMCVSALVGAVSCAHYGRLLKCEHAVYTGGA